MKRHDFTDDAPPRLTPRQRRLAVAIAQALLPASARAPAPDERTVELTASVLAQLIPATKYFWHHAHDLLGTAAFLALGQRITSMNAEGRERAVQVWLKTPATRGLAYAIASGYRMVHFDQPGVYDKLGGKLNVVQNVETPPWTEGIVKASEWDEEETIEADVVVIGTGAGGAVVGRELARKGQVVVFVEAGDFLQRDSFTGSSLNAFLGFYETIYSLGNAPMPIFTGRLVGGSTAVNGGTCFRPPRWVMDRWCENTRSDDFSPEALAPYFNKTEAILHVEEPERRVTGPISDIIGRGCDALGWHHAPILRNAPGCEASGFCDFGCSTDARRSTNLSYIPHAIEDGSMVFTGLKADEVLLEGGRAVGIAGYCTDRPDKRLKIRGKAVVLAAGTMNSPVLLLRQGLANSSAQVGANLTLHPSGGVGGVFEERVDGARSIPQAYHCAEFLKEGLLFNAALGDYNAQSMTSPFLGQDMAHFMDHIDHLATLGVLIAEEARGRIRLTPKGPVTSYSLTRKDTALLARGMYLGGLMLLEAGAKEVHASAMPGKRLFTRQDLERFQCQSWSGSDMMVVSYHPLGTCRMGADRSTSVVDKDHQCHDVPGLYVVDGSTVNGPLGVNPQVTIMALATRAADRIGAHLDDAS